MTDPDLIRFLDAQDQICQQVLQELAAGRKETHWMWFIFSGMAAHYAIRDLDQAKRYLADSILGPRLRQVVKLLIAQRGKSAFEVLGSRDDSKLRSCLTLFREAAVGDSDRALFSKALDQFYGGEPDCGTLELLKSET